MTKPITKSRIKVEPDKKTKGWELLKDGIKNNVLYRKPYNTKRTEATNIIRENCEKVKKIVPGQVIYFNYFEPKTKEELEYYDSTPCTIYFCSYNSKEGRRIIGYNLHYFPPKMRYKIMDAIFRLFRPMFLSTWEKAPNTATQYFSYDFIMGELSKYHLEFGVRQYDPKLMSETHLVPTKWLSTALFTEGHFKKETRAQIMSYWKKWYQNGGKVSKDNTQQEK